MQPYRVVVVLLIVTLANLLFDIVVYNATAKCLFTQLFICRSIVMQNNVMKDVTNSGQHTEMLNASRKLQAIAITVLFEIAYQNSNLGNLIIGRHFVLLVIRVLVHLQNVKYGHLFYAGKRL